MDDKTLKNLTNYLIEAMKDIFPTKDELKEEVSHLPTKEEYYDSEAKLMKELRDLRDEVTTSTHRSSINSDRLDDHDKKLQILMTS